jgi:hypothetical protein
MPDTPEVQRIDSAPNVAVITAAAPDSGVRLRYLRNVQFL